MGRSIDSPADRSITGADFLQLDRAEAPDGGLSDWLAQHLRRAISDGRLPVGSRLPATRVLAGDLGVSRGVVTEAYRRLAEDGQLAGRGRAGTQVVAAPLVAPPPAPPLLPAPAPGAGVPAADHAVFGAAPGVEIFDALRAARCRIDLSPGLPDLAAFPRTAWLRAERAVLDGLPPPGFGYGDPRGAPAFRLAVANWLARNRGIRVSPDEVIVVAGVAQALALLARTLRADGLRSVAVEDPGSLGARQQLQSWQMDTLPIPVDDRGLQVDQLRTSGAQAVMLTPAHQFPMGVILDGARRRQLRQWARDGGLIIEDDYDAEHRYDRPPVPALRAALPGQVCYAGSISKLLAPALRVGWVLAPARYHDALVTAKRDADLGNAILPQLVLAELMNSGELERHLRFLRRRHVRRRDAMIGAVGIHLPGARVHGAAAGLHLTLTFDGLSGGAGRSGAGPSGAGRSDIDLAAAALARGVKTQPLSWHRQRPGRPGLVLGYAASTPAEIHDGIAVLGSILSR
ncbi:MAG: GntR family transcriptional regulator / MocR family aminotransferase [Streptosporangiaceae bacterium]|nr:GntR family transcriptional regulator / MocR family aminotransferase [Streptosporangiaceae bacterium]